MTYSYKGVTEQRAAALKRKRDAAALLYKGKDHTRGAMYLGGYAIECKIKAIAMERHGCQTLDELRRKLRLANTQVYSHALEVLMQDLLPSGSAKRLLLGDAGDAFRARVNQWSVQWRYDARNPSQGVAHEFLDAIDVVWDWLENNV
jgi:hypothetical protein